MSDLDGRVAIITGASGGLGSRLTEVRGLHRAAVAPAARGRDRPAATVVDDARGRAI
ncbi:MAG: hypothetical protein IT545_01420 [Rhodobacteraceae bacterium]|nr:hypothetical protein [Paracoccaceae bacterium]